VGTLGYIARKVGLAFLTLGFVLVFNFFLFRATGDPITNLSRAARLTQADQEALRKDLGICQPQPGEAKCSLIELAATFPTYARETLQGNFGRSVLSGQKVSDMINERIWKTMLLLGLGTVFSIVLGILIGIRGAWKRGSAFDKTTLYGSMTLYSMPEGWLGMLLILLFGSLFAIFPSSGFQSAGERGGFDRIADVANHLFLPVLVLTLGYIGEYAIVMRASLLEMMGEDFVQTARAKGVPDRLVRKRHAVPNAILPTFTLVFLSFGFVVGGAIIVESVFSFPGLGLMTYQAIGEQDYPVLQAVFLISSAAVIIFNLVADILYGYLDPRIRQSG